MKLSYEVWTKVVTNACNKRNRIVPNPRLLSAWYHGGWCPAWVVNKATRKEVK
jgi:hypothetical protein